MTGATASRDLLESAQEALRRCEGELRALVVEAANTSQYDEIDRLTAIARSLHEMTLSTASAQRIDRLAHANSAHLGVARARPPRARRPHAKRYPRFARDGDDLVKIGWSKKKKEEYIHRARRGQAEAIVAALASMGTRKTPLSVETILEIPDQSGTEIPKYQVYLTVAWLREEGLLERRGRKGYVIPDAEQLHGSFGDLWSALPEYRNP